MEEKIKQKPQLHQSHLAILYRCGEKFRRVVIEGEREPATIPLIVGSATHVTVAKNLNNKIDKGTLFTKEAVQDYSRDDFIQEWQNSPVTLNDQEREQGLERTKDFAQDQTIKLVTAHHYDLAPIIKPITVERKWVLEARGYPYDMAGTIDIDEKRMMATEDQKVLVELNGLRDTKTRKTNLGQREVDCSEQYTFYAFAKYMLDGKIPDYVIQDSILKPTERRDAYCVSFQSTRTEDDFKVVMKRFDQANKIIKAGIYTPANPTDWWCTKEFCGFALNGTCPYYNSKTRKPVVNPVIQKKETDNGTDKERGQKLITRLERSLSS